MHQLSLLRSVLQLNFRVFALGCSLGLVEGRDGDFVAGNVLGAFVLGENLSPVRVSALAWFEFVEGVDDALACVNVAVVLVDFHL